MERSTKPKMVVCTTSRAKRRHGLRFNFRSPKTGTWDRWTTVAAYDVALVAGINTISIVFDATHGNANWLNLDELRVA